MHVEQVMTAIWVIAAHPNRKRHLLATRQRRRVRQPPNLLHLYRNMSDIKHQLLGYCACAFSYIIRRTQS